ncbi:MAG: ribosome recycling factor [Bacteroidaceae bacterium]|nr:ribosome recycling factor [Bacteroidaceae bacterium]
MDEVKQYLNDAEEAMEMAAMALEEKLSRIRAGRANVHILDGIRVDSYGAMMPLANVANLSTPDARSIVIKPWDRNMLKVIEKAIIDSPIGIMPENNGEQIRLGIPVLTEDRRKELSKQCSKEAEQAKVSVRNSRRDAIELLKKSVKNGVPEDVEKDAEADCQKVHDKYIKKIDAMLEEKNKEIMTV